jgi:cytochrome c-type biogenesis protein CcmH/NrfG
MLDIGNEIKQSMKEQRLDQYRRRYFELELDRVALLSNQDVVGAAEVVKRMTAVEEAYNAVDSIVIE